MKISKVLLTAVALPAVLSISVVVAAQAPSTITVRDRTIIATLHAEGAQIYECKADAARSPADPGALTWQFREPIATLITDGKTIGRHYAGPNWEHTDGSAVRGKVIASAPGATSNDIPHLELEVVEHRGSGILSTATIVQRTNTKGGVAQGSCERAGEYRNVPYSADYTFLRN